MSPESRPFLPSKELLEVEKTLAKDRSMISFRSFIVHIFVFATYSIAFIYLNQQAGVTSVHPISDLDIRYKAVVPISRFYSPYAGPPSELADQSWHDLLQNMNLRVTREEISQSNQTSIILPDGGGYLAWIGAHHELHCIKMIRKWVYREYYYPNLTAEGVQHWQLHTDHCLEMLRSAAMCHGDTTLTTFYWGNQEKPEPDTRKTEYRCVDWDALIGSVKNRIVDAREMSALVNPRLI